MLWTAATAVAMTVIGALAVGLVYLASQVMAFLQPILVPFAVAGVGAYLLEPGVQWLERRGLSRQRSVLLVFAVFTLAITGLGWWFLPRLVDQTANLAKRVPEYSQRARTAVVNFAAQMEKDYGVMLLPLVPGAGKDAATGTSPQNAAAETNAPVEETHGLVTAAAQAPADAVHGLAPATTDDPLDYDLHTLLTGDWVNKNLPLIAARAGNFIKSSVGGFLGVFGFLLSFIIVPLYLYYFLIESAKIKAQWSDYLPLRASAFKDEVVECLTEINGYLVAFFRGQLFVSIINGIATALGLMIIGLDFGVLIGLGLCVAGLIPYLGNVICWVPAVIIGAVQGGSALIPGDPWWALPLAVTVVFAVVQQIDALFITPRIVGDAVGLHPMTVIVSMLLWSLLLGGLVGAILAVPLSASVKVLFQRYIWRARLAPQTIGGAGRAQGEAPATSG